MRSWLVAALILCLLAVAWLLRETFVLAEALGRAESAARLVPPGAAATDPATATKPPDAVAPTTADLDPVAYARQALELAATKERLVAVEALLEQQHQQASIRAAMAAAATTEPMPEGVRSCLVALRSVLRDQGFVGPRFLRAGRLAGLALEDVEVLDGDPEGIDVAFVQAARMTATLDRGTGRFELKFFDGGRTLAGERTPLPKDGNVLAFDGIDGRVVEAALPFLVQVQGVYPDPPVGRTKAASDVDPLVRRQWLERLDRVLGESGIAPAFRINRFRGMQDGWFLTAELVGTDDKQHVVGGAHCERVAIEVDEATGVVSLLLQSGVLRRGARESSISSEGFRMLLPKLTPASARQAMLGMVVTK